MNCLSKLIKKIITLIKYPTKNKCPRLRMWQNHRWCISILCPEYGVRCQACHYKRLSEKEALEYSKTSDDVKCYFCRKRYN